MAQAHRRELATPSTQTGDDPPMLVAFASKHQSTKGVAQRIASRLRDGGANVDLRPAGQVADAGAFDAVVLGSAVFNQRWTPEAEQFIERNMEALGSRPVWLFSVGAFGDRKRVIGPLMKLEPRNIRALEGAIHPRDYRVFAGVIERKQWPFGSRLLFHALGGRLGDNRDWSAIDAWADDIGRALRADASRARTRQA